MTVFKDSIIVPSEVHEIVQICPNITNGAAFLSVYNEKTNEQILNSMRIANDKVGYNFKAVDVVNFPDYNNLNYILKIIDTDIEQDCWLKILIAYKLKKEDK